MARFFINGRALSTGLFHLGGLRGDWLMAISRAAVSYPRVTEIEPVARLAQRD